MCYAISSTSELPFKSTTENDRKKGRKPNIDGLFCFDVKSKKSVSPLIIELQSDLCVYA